VPDLDFEKAMKAEHCTKEGAEKYFVTKNYKIKTNAKREWSIVVDKEPLKHDEEAHGRVVPDLEKLQRLEIAEKASLLKIEIIAMVLYTGPMVSSKSIRFGPILSIDVMIKISVPCSTWCTMVFCEEQKNCIKSLGTKILSQPRFTSFSRRL
jgi:hypothetical protein